MDNSMVRLESITVHNFKNVVEGRVRMENLRKPYKASIVGIYGQNGSGKTAMIDAIALLKYALCGQPIPSSFADSVNIDADHATLEYEIKVVFADATYNAFYAFDIRKEQDPLSQNDDTIEQESHYKTVLTNELLSYSYESGQETIAKKRMISTDTLDVFIPKASYDIVVGRDKEQLTNLLVVKKLAYATSRSFVFSRELMNVAKENCSEKRHIRLWERLVEYGNYELFVIGTRTSGLISLNALPISFKYVENGVGAIGKIAVPLESTAVVPVETFAVIEVVTKSMNVVLSQIIPGLSICVNNLGQQITKSGNMGVRIQMTSRKNGKDIPLRYESEGIKKIVSILQLLIVVYNNSSTTVAIDELDSGIFEYLLGELLRIISEKGRGQLIFTSHNLRPMETIDKGFIVFTTTNPNNRYIRMKNVKGNNNLRDFYYRDIVLGEQSEPVYDSTNNYEIALAFQEAGEICAP